MSYTSDVGKIAAAIGGNKEAHAALVRLCEKNERMREALQKISKRYPCKTAHAMNLVAFLAIGRDQ